MDRYKRILAVGDSKIATLNPSTFEVTNEVTGAHRDHSPATVEL